MDNAAIWIAIATCLMGGFFAACNVALRTYSKSKLTELLEARGREDELKSFYAHAAALSLMTAAARVVLVLVFILAVLDLLEPQIGDPFMRSAAALGISVVIVAITSVAIPASWAQYHAESVLAWSLPVLQLCRIVLTPLLLLLQVFDPIVRRITGADIGRDDDDSDFVSDEVLSVVEEHQSTGKVDEGQREMIEAVFDFANITAGEIMTPRTDIKGIEANATLEQVKDKIIDAGFSRFPVYEGNLDNIHGVLYAKDLIRFLGRENGFELANVLRNGIMVPESKPVRELLAEFQARKVHIAIVLDEYGGTAGLVTIEDIIEELVGDIQDEYEPVVETPAIRVLDDKTAEVDARVRIDELNDDFDIELPEDEDFDTVGGFVFSTLGHIPETGEQFDFDGLRFTVTEAERTKVIKVRIEKMETESASTNGNSRTSNGK